ncbi:hypothetical protein GF380_00465, partial [Candidatus Uhrbacteria bacterium]|nr:hypothetical protein [Candidatus Uhrbacteria bacterium]
MNNIIQMVLVTLLAVFGVGCSGWDSLPHNEDCDDCNDRGPAPVPATTQPSTTTVQPGPTVIYTPNPGAQTPVFTAPAPSNSTVYIPIAYPQPVQGEQCTNAPECGGCATCEALCGCFGGDAVLCATHCDALRNGTVPTTTDPTPQPNPTACIPNQQRSCPCLGGGMGVQSCEASGNAYGACACADPTPQPNPTACIPNQQTACACQNGTGVQVCNSAGSAYNTCACPDPTDPGPVQACVPNQQVHCACSNGQGVQVCNSAGSAYGTCQCPSNPPTNTGGTSGSGGTGGSGGTTGGTSGSGGTGGSVTPSPEDIVTYVITIQTDSGRDKPFSD